MKNDPKITITIYYNAAKTSYQRIEPIPSNGSFKGFDFSIGNVEALVKDVSHGRYHSYTIDR